MIPPDRVVDPDGRDGCRAPIPWTADDGHGWGPRPWLPFPPDAAAKAAATQVDDPSSMLSLYRRLLDLRRAEPALRRGTMQVLDPDPAAPHVLEYRRELDGDAFVVLVNIDAEPAVVALDGELVVSSRP